MDGENCCVRTDLPTLSQTGNDRRVVRRQGHESRIDRGKVNLTGVAIGARRIERVKIHRPGHDERVIRSKRTRRACRKKKRRSQQRGGQASQSGVAKDMLHGFTLRVRFQAAFEESARTARNPFSAASSARAMSSGVCAALMNILCSG